MKFARYRSPWRKYLVIGSSEIGSEREGFDARPKVKPASKLSRHVVNRETDKLFSPRRRNEEKRAEIFFPPARSRSCWLIHESTTLKELDERVDYLSPSLERETQSYLALSRSIHNVRSREYVRSDFAEKKERERERRRDSRWESGYASSSRSKEKVEPRKQRSRYNINEINTRVLSIRWRLAWKGKSKNEEEEEEEKMRRCKG